MQIVTSFGGFFLCCGLMYAAYRVGFWPAAVLVLPAAGFVVRIFIIQHDCGHAAFFRSRRANDVLGMVCSLFTLAPYTAWRRHHAAHHGVWNNLSRRQAGVDFYSTVLTVAEFNALPRWKRLLHRVSLHPLMANVVLPSVIFLLVYRVPFDMPRAWRVERWTQQATNLAIVALVIGLGLVLGFWPVLTVQLPVMIAAATIGVWLFSIQHRFETAHWANGDTWRHVDAALDGSSYLRLNRVLRWFTGNIGLHHIHHLNPRVPNYRLQAAQDAIPRLSDVRPLGLRKALGAWRFVLWDEVAERLVTFRAARKRA